MVTLCLTCRTVPARARGCCTVCYQRHRYAVHEGLDTWEALVQQGKALPARRYRRCPAPTYDRLLGFCRRLVDGGPSPELIAEVCAVVANA